MNDVHAERPVECPSVFNNGSHSKRREPTMKRRRRATRSNSGSSSDRSDFTRPRKQLAVKAARRSTSGRASSRSDSESRDLFERVSEVFTLFQMFMEVGLQKSPHPSAADDSHACEVDRLQRELSILAQTARGQELAVADLKRQLHAANTSKSAHEKASRWARSTLSFKIRCSSVLKPLNVYVTLTLVSLVRS